MKVELEVIKLAEDNYRVVGPSPFVHDYFGEGILKITVEGPTEDEAILRYNLAYAYERDSIDRRVAAQKMVDAAEKKLVEVET